MGKRTYTEHKLTEPMLKRLSKAANGRDPGGMSVLALKRRGLVRYERKDPQPTSGCLHRTVITEAGRDALAQARREGW